LSSVRVARAGRESLDLVEPLWMSMHRHHEAVSPMIGRFGPLPDVSALWERRRAHYEQWLAEPRSALLLARVADEAVGYAMVRLRVPRRAWEPRGLIGTLETLAVDESRRGLGIGTVLLSAVRELLTAEGATVLELSVLEGNEQAMRFYEHQGLRPALVTLMGPV
jgi:ribosomal protein S18 acetylase RimI-like enzyme